MHDPERGEFYQGEPREPHHKRFTVGEVVKLKGEEFEVQEIGQYRLVLRPLSEGWAGPKVDAPEPRERRTWDKKRPWG